MVQPDVSPSRARSSALGRGSESQNEVEEERVTTWSSTSTCIRNITASAIAPETTSRRARSPLELQRADPHLVSASSRVDHNNLDPTSGGRPPLINKFIAMCDMTSSQQQGLDEAEKTGMKEENQKKEEYEKEQNEEEKEDRKRIDTDMVSSRQALGASISRAPDADGSMSTSTGPSKITAIGTGATEDTIRFASETETKVTNTSSDLVLIENGPEEQGVGMDLEEERSKWSPALPIHALTCDDQAGTGRMEEGSRRETGEGSQAVIRDQLAQQVIPSVQGTYDSNGELLRLRHEEAGIPLVPPPQGSMLGNLLRGETRPAQLSDQNAAANGVATSNMAPASASSTTLPISTVVPSPPRPFLPLQPTRSLFERRILRPPRAPHAPPFERRATVGSDLLSDTRRDPWYPSNIAMQSRQPSGALFGSYDMAPLTPGVGVMMPMDLDPGGSTRSWDRPRPTSSPGPGGRPVLREPYRRRGSIHLPGLSNSNPARSLSSLSNLTDTKTLGEHRRRSSAERRLQAFSPYRGVGAGAAIGARSRGLTVSQQNMSPGSETEDPFQQASLPVAGPNGHRPSVLESRLPGGSEESDEPGRRPNIAGKSVKSTRMGMACIICRKRKIKCSGDQPCEDCARHDRICQYRPIPVEESRAERERRSRRARRSSEREM